VPVVGGNVSLYNETERGPIYPTPVVGMVGEVPDPTVEVGLELSEGDSVAVIGDFRPSPAGSELAKQRGQLALGLPERDLGAAIAAIEAVREAVRAGGLGAVHDIGDGGLGCALAECVVASGVGIEADLSGLAGAGGASGEELLFGEGPGAFVVSGPSAALEDLAARAGGSLIGRAGGGRLRLTAGESEVELAIEALRGAWDGLGDRIGAAQPL
jgi:phosphoribosylformylglycinamidine synthase